MPVHSMLIATISNSHISMCDSCHGFPTWYVLRTHPDKAVATQSKAACKFIIEFTGRVYDFDKVVYALMHPPRLVRALPHCVTKVTTHNPLPKQTQYALHTKYVPI